MTPGRVQNMGASFENLFPVPQFGWGLHYTLAVENVTTNPRCLFTPYGLSSGENISGLQAEYVADGFLRSSNIFAGTHSYKINAVSSPTQGMSYGVRLYQHWEDNLIPQPLGEYRQAYFDDGGREQAFMAAANPQGELFEELVSDHNNLYSRSLKLPDWAKQPLSKERRALVNLTERYNDFVAEKYLQLPEDSEGPQRVSVGAWAVDAQGLGRGGIRSVFPAARVRFERELPLHPHAYARARGPRFCGFLPE